MTVNKRKKHLRLMGSRTHGWGSHKKHRGMGHHGGAGMAGTGKRADSKKPSIWKNENYFGKHGFTRKNAKEAKAINVGDLEKELPKLLSEKKIKKENNTYIIDLQKIGFHKLLGNGKIKSKMIITTEQATKKATDKITKADGEVKTGGENVAEKHTNEPAGSSKT